MTNNRPEHLDPPGADEVVRNPEAAAIQPSHEHHWFAPPTKPVSGLFIASILIAQFVFFIALLGPAIVGVQLKVLKMFPTDTAQQVTANQIATGVGALGAVIANVVFGRLSDRTTAKWGRRRPWIVGGTIGMLLAFTLMGLGNTVFTLTLGWFLAQVGANATLAPFIATLSDQVPEQQRAKLSSWIGIAQNVAVMVATYLAQMLQNNMAMLFIVPAIFAVAAMTWYAFVLPDQHLPVKPPAMNLREWAETFWVSPRENPDYALAWWGRFLITAGSFMFTTFRLFFLVNQIELTQERAVSAVTISVIIYTVTLVIFGYIGGILSDRLKRRKIFVIISSALFGVGLGLLGHATTVNQFYLVEALMGAAFGVYMGVDLALVIDVLPNPDDAGKDLGVFNMANALPQTLSPFLAGALVKIGSPEAQNYTLLCWVAAIFCVIGAILVIPIKKVR